MRREFRPALVHVGRAAAVVRFQAEEIGVGTVVDVEGAIVPFPEKSASFGLLIDGGVLNLAG
jgi:hypothetical protein